MSRLQTRIEKLEDHIQGATAKPFVSLRQYVRALDGAPHPDQGRLVAIASGQGSRREWPRRDGEDEEAFTSRVCAEVEAECIEKGAAGMSLVEVRDYSEGR